MAGLRAARTGIAFQAEPLETDFTDRAPYVVWYGRTAPPAPQVAFTRSGPPLRAGFLRVQQNLLLRAVRAPGRRSLDLGLPADGTAAGS